MLTGWTLLISENQRESEHSGEAPRSDTSLLYHNPRKAFEERFSIL